MHKKIRRFQWDLQRFGLTPKKVYSRAVNQNSSRIIIISIPKAGTHLVERALCLVPSLYRSLTPTLHSQNIRKFGGLETQLQKAKPGSIISTHLHFSDEYQYLIEKYKIKPLIVIRNPYDIVVSRAHYIADKRHPYYQYAVQKTLAERLHIAITGDKIHGFLSLRETLEKFLRWKESSKTHVIRFEKLIDAGYRTQCLDDIFTFLDIQVSKSVIKSISENLVSDASPTFRKGTIGEGKVHLSGDLHNLFWESVGDLVTEYGY